jgi:hypothetical protein
MQGNNRHGPRQLGRRGEKQMAMGKVTPTKAEVVRLVKEGNSAVAWVTAKGAIVHVPTQPAGLIAGVTATFFEGTPVVVVSGVRGLSAIDPEWDGQDLFTCSNPQCKQTHNSDWATHDNLWKKVTNAQQGSQHQR